MRITYRSENSKSGTPIVATGLRQSSLRGYDNRRYGVTTNTVTEQVDMAALQRRKQRCSDDWETPDSQLLQLS
ncbi:hypothetical protein O3689_12440 [Prevotella nigrescens]|uniref:hypothetical protein n=1 Tax=Prevotella nigrescens TaxID=28133 RepID=UPI0028ED2527|nr:hypothetical protein [Prevotella nigrescens]